LNWPFGLARRIGNDPSPKPNQTAVNERINIISFDMGKGGKATLSDPPLEPITTSYQK
jgi:hypothetical protein